MALSGSIRTQVDNYFELELRWSATQNSTNKTSTITAILYWRSQHYQATTTSSNNREAAIAIEGTSATAYVNPSLSGNQTKELTRLVKTVAHAADGSKSVMLYSRYTFMLTISGKYYDEARCDGLAELNSFAVSNMKVYNGASWQTATARVWNGTAWKTPVGMWVWDGNSWSN